jgi:hypothetical protein
VPAAGREPERDLPRAGVEVEDVGATIGLGLRLLRARDVADDGEGLALRQELKDPVRVAQSQTGLAEIALEQGKAAEAEAFARMAAPTFEEQKVTDLATLLYRHEERLLGAARDPNTFYRETVLPAKLVLNLGYLRSRSFLRDLKLIHLTIRYSLFPKRFDPELIKRALGAGVLNE